MTENIRVNKQSSIRITDGERVIYVDPLEISGEPKDGDLILITHDHYDHFSPEDVRKVAKSSSVLVVPSKMAGKAREVADAVSRTVNVEPGKHYEVEGVALDTVAAYNVLKPFHPKSAGWVGYILLLGDQRIYVAGDTDVTKEAKAVKCDIAMVPVGGTYTMDAKKAAELVNIIQPEVAIPTHYGSIVGKPADGENFASYVSPGIRVEYKLEF